MSTYTDRTQFFRELAGKSKMIAHGRPIGATSATRKSFFRLHTEEALAGQVGGMHFPCLVQMDYGVKPVDRNGSERLLITHQFMVLVKPDSSIGKADAMEAAYDQAETALQQLISWMLNEYEEKGSCGPFKNIELSMFSWEPTDAVLDSLYGFYLDMREEQPATAITTFDQSKFFD